jgi:hypothetical protein
LAVVVALSCLKISLHPFIKFLSQEHGQASCHFGDTRVTFHERLANSHAKQKRNAVSQIFSTRMMNRRRCFVLHAVK